MKNNCLFIVESCEQTFYFCERGFGKYRTLFNKGLQDFTWRWNPNAQEIDIASSGMFMYRDSTDLLQVHEDCTKAYLAHIQVNEYIVGEKE